ncbi:MAG: hypothetical protein AAFV80_20575 [Bacteroidota bacterium]
MASDNVNWKGKILVIAQNSIVVEANAHLEQVILIAPSIQFKKGFQGSIQAYASDQLIVEEEVQLHYPSILGFIDKNPEEKGQFSIFRKGKVNGLIIADVSFV